MSGGHCALCSKPRASHSSGYCAIHERALSKLKEKYHSWQVAYENISWERYLETIIGLMETGDLAKAVAVEELRKVHALGPV